MVNTAVPTLCITVYVRCYDHILANTLDSFLLFQPVVLSAKKKAISKSRWLPNCNAGTETKDLLDKPSMREDSCKGKLVKNGNVDVIYMLSGNYVLSSAEQLGH